MTSSIFASVTCCGSYSICTVLAGMSTETVFTPFILPTEPSMACWQCSHDMSGATRVVFSIVFSPLFVFLVIALLIPCNGIELDQLLNDRFLPITFHPLGYTGT